MRFNPGDRIGTRFEVQKQLGRGGVGIVYEVKDLQRDVVVAMKVLNPEIAKNELAIARLKREVTLMRRIAHDGIVQIYDTGRFGETLFYTMECVYGKSIAELLRQEGPFPVDCAVDVMVKACDVIEGIHAVAIHRDLSTDNIMIEDYGEVRILDFGTARDAGEESELTAVGLHIGKVFYSAPEQQKNSKQVDQRADLYSLGVIFFEMLTNKRVLKAEPITDYRFELSPEWNEFFVKALARDPNERFSSAAEFSAAIQALQRIHH